MDQAFRDAMTAGYALTEPGLILGSPMLDGELVNDARVQVALSMMNRHGLIAGATGTGKTKTLQLLAGQLSKAGVPVFVADIKGDLTGLAAPGDATNPKVIERVTSLGWTFEPSGHPVEFLSLSGKLGAQVRATVHSFGPLLLGKVLDLNDTQTSILALVFKYCDDNDLPLLDLKDLAATLKFLVVRRGQADPRRLRRDVERIGRRAPALDRRARAGRRRHLLRRARVRRRTAGAPHRRRSTASAWAGRRPRAALVQRASIQSMKVREQPGLVHDVGQLEDADDALRRRASSGAGRRRRTRARRRRCRRPPARGRRSARRSTPTEALDIPP